MPAVHPPLFDCPTDPLCRAFVDDALTRSLALSKHIHGDDPRSHARDALFVQEAAVVAWRARPWAPRWEALDIDALLERLAAAPDWQRLRPEATLSLLSFVCHLGREGFLEPAAAKRLQSRLEWEARLALESMVDHLLPRTDAA